MTAVETTEEYRNDGALINGLTGMGIAQRDKTQSTTVGTVRLLSPGELEVLYAVGLPRRYVDAIADEVVKHHPTVKLGGDKDEDSQDFIRQFEAYLRAVGLHRAYPEAVRLQRLYGGGGIVLLIDDGQEADQPVAIDRIRGIRGMIPLSRHELIPGDFSFIDYSKPEFYRISTTQKLAEDQTASVTQFRIHHTRVARFDGLYLPWRIRNINEGWGQSPLQVIWDSWRRYESSIGHLEASLSDASQFWHKVPGMFNMIKGGGAPELMKRLEVNNLARSVYGGMLLDKDEEIGFVERALSNLQNATAPFVEYLQSTTGWPASILTGASPGGLGKEGRFEERVWASLCEKWQLVHCREPLEMIYSYMLASREGPTKGKPPESWEVHFPSVFVETDKELAELRKLQADTDNVNVTMGALSPVEVRNNRFGGTEYSLETVLDEQVSQQLKLKADVTFESEVNGMLQAQMQPGAEGDPNAAETAPGAEPPAPEAAPADPGPILPEAEEEPEAPPTKPAKRKDRYDARELEITVAREVDGVSLGAIHTDAASIPLLLGPHRSRKYAVYAAPSGALLTGFASLRAARQGLAAVDPDQASAPLVRLPEDEAEALLTAATPH